MGTREWNTMHQDAGFLKEMEGGIKLAGALAAGVAALVVPIRPPLNVIALGVLLLGVAAVGRIRPSVLLCRLVPLVGLAVFGLLLVWFAPIGTDANVYAVPLIGCAVSARAFDFLLALVVRSGLLVIVATILTETASLRDFLVVAERLRLPATVTGITYVGLRMADASAEQMRKTMRAVRARGKPRGVRKLKLAGSVARTFLLRTVGRSEKMALAMCARGFRGRLPVLRRSKISTTQVVVLAGLVGLLWGVIHL